MKSSTNKLKKIKTRKEFWKNNFIKKIKTYKSYSNRNIKKLKNKGKFNKILRMNKMNQEDSQRTFFRVFSMSRMKKKIQMIQRCKFLKKFVSLSN